MGSFPDCNCLPGSAIVDGKCQKCPPNFYTLKENAEKCLECPEGAFCKFILLYKEVFEFISLISQ